MKTRSIGWITVGAVCLLTTACSVPAASLYVKSQSCRENLLNSVATIVLRDKRDIDVAKAAIDARNDAERMDLVRDILIASFSPAEITAMSRGIGVGQEFNQIHISIGATRYEFLVQNDEPNACWLRLYKKKSDRSSYTNTMTFIDSERVTGCTCSGNQIHIGL